MVFPSCSVLAGASAWFLPLCVHAVSWLCPRLLQTQATFTHWDVHEAATRCACVVSSQLESAGTAPREDAF